jgi:hypothetical protein
MVKLSTTSKECLFYRFALGCMQWCQCSCSKTRTHILHVLVLWLGRLHYSRCFQGHCRSTFRSIVYKRCQQLFHLETWLTRLLRIAEAGCWNVCKFTSAALKGVKEEFNWTCWQEGVPGYIMCKSDRLSLATGSPTLYPPSRPHRPRAR